ncbi:hypothetical protein [Sodalinema gerasimenkoae]|uniref:hypothetical protein n=1 Tax=Sodalinema gerasimenkoae TaxID=2862348 RepID=UPI00135A9EC5|nr:hypothetical protein [Sodalinema gerasimenkoae]
MVRLNEQKKQLLEQFTLQELALLISQAIALESDRQGGNFTLDWLSREFGHLAFKYGDVLNALPSQEAQDSHQTEPLSLRA